jgi:hypothetical protein
VQHNCHLVKTTALTTLHKLTDLPHLPSVTCLVGRRPKYHPQASHLVGPHQRSHSYANSKVGFLRNNSRTFTKRLNFLLFLYLVSFFVFFFSILLISPSLFSYPYSYPLHFPSFSYATIHYSPSQLLFLPLLIHSLPHLHFPSILP